MLLRVSEMRMPIDGDEQALIADAIRRAGLDRDEVASVELSRKSLDRRRGRVELVYTFDLHLVEGRSPRSKIRRDARVAIVDEDPPEEIGVGDRRLEHRPIVVGAGPGGLFAALVLARRGFRPIVIERGTRMNERVRHIEAFYRGRELKPESNYLFGEGGAGTFSDGKLTSRSKDPRARFVLDEFRKKSGFEAVRYYYRPHLGSDRVRAVVGHLRREIESLGGEFRYAVRVDHVRHRNGRLIGLETSAGDVAADVVVCAPGHSARDFYANLWTDGVKLERKAFQMGFRVEHPQEFVNERVWRCAADAEKLGPADYRLATTIDGRGVFSFCMCPGGEIIPSVHDTTHFCTNGMSYFNKDSGFANSGIVTTIEVDEFSGDGPLAGIALQEEFEKRSAVAAGERFALPAQRLTDFCRGESSRDVPKTSCRSGEHPSDVAQFAPPWVTEVVRKAIASFDRQLRGFVDPRAIICGPESRSSSPVRIVRDDATMESPGMSGLYPVGEGAGYAGGIVSAAIDGVRAAEKIVGIYLPTAG